MCVFVWTFEKNKKDLPKKVSPHPPSKEKKVPPPPEKGFAPQTNLKILGVFLCYLHHDQSLLKPGRKRVGR